jgi:hypothetical protein
MLNMTKRRSMQKAPFAFYLSALTFLVIALSFSCSMNPDMQTPGQAWLQGEWQQDSVPMQKQLISYSLYHMKFDCDSFFVTMKTFSKVNYGADSCMSKGNWTEYASGHYEQLHDTLFLKGNYDNPDFSIKEDPGCLHAGVYKEIFKINSKTDSLIQFSSTSGVIPVNARRIKKTTCTVKPL